MNNKCVRILEFYNKPENATLDSLLFYISGIGPSTFDPIQNDLVGSGAIEILKNEALKELLISWSTDVMQLKETEQHFFRHYENNLIPYLGQQGVLRDVSFYGGQQQIEFLLESEAYVNPIPGKSKLKATTKDDLLSDSKLEGMVAWALNVNTVNNQESESLMKRIDYILEVLDEQIKN